MAWEWSVSWSHVVSWGLRSGVGEGKTYVGVRVVVYAVAGEVVLGAAVGFVGGDLAFFETVCGRRGHQSEELVVVAGARQQASGGHVQRSYRQRYLAKLPGFSAWVMLKVSCARARAAAERAMAMLEKRMLERLWGVIK